MIWDTKNRSNFLACANELEANGFNVQITTIQFRGANYQIVCALGEVEEHLLQMVVNNDDAGSSIDPDELLANAHTLSAKTEEVHQRQMLTSVNRVLGYKCNPEIARAVVSRLDPNHSCPMQHAGMRDAVLLQAQADYLTTTLKHAIAQQQSEKNKGALCEQ